MNKYKNSKLDKYQRKAVVCNYHTYLVVAGAGSGKPFTIVEKVKYLLENGYKNSEILCISFTNETVNELKDRLDKNNSLVDVKTFHRLSLDIIGTSYKISSSDLLKYITNEYFESFIYHDNTYKLLNYIDNLDYIKNVIVSFINR